jgi:hypothetical protein
MEPDVDRMNREAKKLARKITRQIDRFNELAVFVCHVSDRDSYGELVYQLEWEMFYFDYLAQAFRDAERWAREREQVKKPVRPKLTLVV